ncbi:hypothetical protein ACFL34_01315 [Candidatus Sumerlaeota bacterium]
MNMRTLNILSKLYYLNPRWLYLVVSVLLLAPMFLPIPNPEIDAAPAAQGVYDTVGRCPDDKVILIDSSWDMGSKPECMALLECFVNDLVKRKKKFVVFSSNVFAPTFVMGVVEPITDKAGYVYGEDWVNLGFILPPGNNQALLVDQLCRDLHALRPFDINSTPLSELPLMQNVKSAQDIHMVYAVNYCPPEQWISFGKSQHGLLVAFGGAAIMAPYYQVYVDSGQLCGLLSGNRGTSEYESLTGIDGMGKKVMMSFGFGLCFIIASVILGNIGFNAARHMRRIS